MKIKTSYKSPKERQPGAIWESNRCGKFEIIGKVDDGTGKYYKIKFLNTGHECIANGSAFKTGTVRDPMARLAFGIGYLGVGSNKPTKNGKITREGHLWYNMLERCYCDKYHENTPTYKDCFVCERWHCFQYFCEDIKKIKGYNDWISNNKYVLDKDKICEGNREYCIDKCCFILNGENTILSNKPKNVYLGIDKLGNKFYFKNQRTFAEKFNLERRGISSVISGKQNTHRGWTFRKLSIEEINNITEIILD